jgi:hypothetical protein
MIVSFHHNLSVILDLKGCQYRGRLFPGPTAMILTAVQSFQRKGVATQQLKIDGITDEFCRLTKTGDSMAKLAGVVHGDMEDYRVDEVDVNRNVHATAASAVAKSEVTNSKDKDTKSGIGSKGTNPRKRGSTTTSTTAPKKRKSSKSKK